MQARAGSRTEKFVVGVVQRLKPEALPINQDKSIHFSLKPGKYELTIELPEVKRLRMEWRSAPYCDYEGTGKKHQATCVLRANGGVVFDNPAWLLRKETSASHEGVTLYEIP